MVALRDAMVLWNSQDYHDKTLKGGFDNTVRIKVVPHSNYQLPSNPNRKFRYLQSSVGACFGGWATAKGIAQAGYIMGLFNRIVTHDGLPADVVHRAFLEIDEYAEFHDDKALKDGNPFQDLHYAYCDPVIFDHVA
jgi:hypothetical protein